MCLSTSGAGGVSQKSATGRSGGRDPGSTTFQECRFSHAILRAHRLGVRERHYPDRESEWLPQIRTGTITMQIYLPVN